MNRLKRFEQVDKRKNMSSVDELINGLDPQQRELVKKLRVIVKRALPSAVEAVKWGTPNYSINGKKVACFMLFDDHVNLGFFKGAQPNSKLLEGTGKGLQHIKVRKAEDIKEEEFTKLLKHAARLV